MNLFIIEPFSNRELLNSMQKQVNNFQEGKVESLTL